jgi:NAD(P)-dependent dehydrogenase (short-subunit alcohol dehydrogenase family)
MSSPVVLITGALPGIGRAAAVASAKAGNRVVVSGRRQNAGEASVGELRSSAEFVQADVRNEDDVRRLDRTVERFGRLDAVVNNAGTEGKPGPVVEQTAESYAATFNTNVLGMLLSLKHELRVMTAQGSGSIVNISSTYGHEGAKGASVYVGSKHAVEVSRQVGGRWFGRAGQRRGTGPDRNRHAQSLHRPAERKAALVSGVPLGRRSTAARPQVDHDQPKDRSPTPQRPSPKPTCGARL